MFKIGRLDIKRELIFFHTAFKIWTNQFFRKAGYETNDYNNLLPSRLPRKHITQVFKNF